MTQNINVADITLPDDTERKRIFYWLKKISSLTAWRRVFTYYKRWADITENSVRTADELGWGQKTSLPESEYVFIMNGLAHCEEGVERLSKGDKRVFKFDSNGEFEMASRAISHWSQMKTRIDEGENCIDEQHTPLWDEFGRTLADAYQAWQDCAFQILEPRYLDDPALTTYNGWLGSYLKRLHFPVELPLVPDPHDNLFVRTGQFLPCSGIWEPIIAPAPKTSILSLFKESARPQPPFQPMGAMNYLHHGSKAPRIDVEAAGDSLSLDTTWRLLWRDDRYNDGTVSAEEAGYCFEEHVDETKGKTPLVTASIVWGESGSEVSLAGRWLLETDLNVSVVLDRGQKLPLHEGREVRWVLADTGQ